MADNFITDDEDLTDETAVDDGLYAEPDEFDFDAELSDGEDAELIVEPQTHPLGRTLAIDTERGALIMSGKGPAVVRGDANLRAWIEKCLMTHEGAHPVHPVGYGLEVPIMEMMTGDSEDGLGELGEMVTEALTFHPMIKGIDRFQILHDVDVDDEPFAEIRFVVLRADDTAEDIEITLNTGETL